jgi:flagellar hook assembly protein FlgD
VTVTPKTFSPDNDGFEDYTTLNFQLAETGFVANITIFDAVGRPVKILAKNATLALTGSFRWDGLNDKFSKVPVGTYVIYTEMFNLEGKKKSFKNTVVVAARF